MPVSSSTHVDLGPSHGVRMTRVVVPMRDGVDLNVSAYTPRAGGKVPAVVELTPYTVDSAHGEGQYFPTQGFAYVVADVRGRGTRRAPSGRWSTTLRTPTTSSTG